MSNYLRLRSGKCVPEPSPASLTHKDIVSLSNELHTEAKTSTPIRESLRKRLESLPRSTRESIVALKKDGCTPLFVACKRGNVELVEYLITVCNAKIEERGLYEVSEDRSIHHVTPLWCAAISNKLPIVKCLVRLGANINAESDTGSTPVRSACFMTNIEVVKFLVENGADIRRPNQNGGSCLINAVQNVELCQYLIFRGIDVNAKDIQDKTALHYAVQEDRLDTVQLLLDHGADPFSLSRHGDDALQLACIRGFHQIFDFLKSRISYPTQRLATAHELMGATMFDDQNQASVAIMHWRLATHMREGYPKVLVPTSSRAYQGMREFLTVEELDNIALDMDAMRTQSLLIYERVLGVQHKDFLYRLMFRGAKYADSLQFQRTIDLWILALQIRVEKYSILHSETVHTAKALVRLMLDLAEQKWDMEPLPQAENLPTFEDCFAVYELLTRNIEEARDLLLIHPINKKQQENYDRVLKCITHLIMLLLQTITTEEERIRAQVITTRLIRSDIRSSSSKDTLLHLCMSSLNVIKSGYQTDDAQITSIFPNVFMTSLLIVCGADVNAVNESGSTPLLIASNSYNFNIQIIKLLLATGAHIDQPNHNHKIPLQQIQSNPQSNIPYLNYLTLKCMAATVVAKYRIPYKNIIPRTLEMFVKTHES